MPSSKNKSNKVSYMTPADMKEFLASSHTILDNPVNVKMLQRFYEITEDCPECLGDFGKAETLHETSVRVVIEMRNIFRGIREMQPDKTYELKKQQMDDIIDHARKIVEGKRKKEQIARKLRDGVEEGIFERMEKAWADRIIRYWHPDEPNPYKDFDHWLYKKKWVVRHVAEGDQGRKNAKFERFKEREYADYEERIFVKMDEVSQTKMEDVEKQMELLEARLDARHLLLWPAHEPLSSPVMITGPVLDSTSHPSVIQDNREFAEYLRRCKDFVESYDSALQMDTEHDETLAKKWTEV
jgi:hypothetical protein